MRTCVSNLDSLGPALTVSATPSSVRLFQINVLKKYLPNLTYSMLQSVHPDGALSLHLVPVLG